MTLVVAALPSNLAAQAPPPDPATPLRATIVRIEGADVFLDVGEARAALGQPLTVYRRIEVRHPVSGKKLQDRFAIGELTVVDVGGTLSLAQARGESRRPFEVGDAVEGVARDEHAASRGVAASPPSSASTVALTTPPAGTLSTPAPAPLRATAGPITNQETSELLRYWQASLGQSPEYRARLYRAYLARFPGSGYASRLVGEIAYLEKLEREVRRGTERAEPAGAPAVEAASIRRAEEGEPIAVALAYRTDARIRSLILHARPRGATVFLSTPMGLDGRGHARAVIPAGAVREEGVEYFVEAVTEDGKTHDVVGTSGAPREVEVYRAARPIPSDEPRTRVRLSSEIVSFDGTSGRDYFLVNEGDFFHRVELGSLYGVRTGYGRYDGRGGTVENLDELELEPERAGFSYGFVETELALAPLVGAALRGTIGLGRPEIADQERDGVTGGAQLRLRIGPGDGARLVLAGEVLPEVGQRAFLGLHWEAIERVPMTTEVHVTDQPVNSDELAVRIVQEVGFRLSDRIMLAARPSYQLRTIRHAGPGIGLAAAFDW